MIKIPNLKPMIVEEYQNTEIFLLKAILQICLEKVLWLKKVQNNVPCTHAISDLNGEKIVETFYKKELGKINVKEFRIEKVIKKKGDKLYVKWEWYDILFNSLIENKNLI